MFKLMDKKIIANFAYPAICQQNNGLDGYKFQGHSKNAKIFTHIKGKLLKRAVIIFSFATTMNLVTLKFLKY